MKKIGRLSINLNKVIKNDELVNLKGGEQMCCYFYEDEEGMNLIVSGPTESCEYCANWAPEGTRFASCNACGA